MNAITRSILLPANTALPSTRLAAIFACAAFAAFCHPAAAAPGDVDAGFNPNADSTVISTTVQADGKVIIGGNFTTVSGVVRNRIARLNADGTLDAGFNPSADNGVWSAAVQADGKIIIGGNFNAVGGVVRNGIARINADGTLDTDFNPNVTTGVYSTAVQADGKIIIGGTFTTVGGVVRNRIARLNADGTLDASFNPNASLTVYSTTVQEDGKIIIGGQFTSIGGTVRNRVARLNADGTLDTGFNPNANNIVWNVAVQAEGKVIIGGGFTSVGGTVRNRIARLNADGTLDTGFSPTANATVWSTTAQADGKIVIGGSFTAVGGTVRNHVARLNADGTLDASFNPSVDNAVLSTAVQADGTIIIGGSFSAVGGVARSNLARLENDVATESLTVPNPSKVQWLRGGSSPETLQVSFELSTDAGANWSPLGNGTRIAGGWERTALALPATGAVRARARTTGGQYNASSGLVETLAVYGPQISGPTSQTGALGSAITFSVDAAALNPLSYQWRKDGTPIPGATASSYTIPSAQPWHIGDYTVVVTHSTGTATSSAALLQINDVPTTLWRGLLAYYPFDGNPLDREPGAAHATVSGAALTSDRLGQSNRAYDFDGIDDQMTATVPNLPVGNAPRTLSLWAKARPDPLRTVGLVEWGLAQDGRAFGIANANSPYTWQGETFGAGFGVNSGAVVDTKWHHVCLTYEGGLLSIYLDGVLRQTKSEAIDTALSTLKLGVGIEGSTFYPGSLDEVRIYNRALSPSDVQQLKDSEDPDADGDGIRDRFETGTGIYVSPENTGTSATNYDSDGDGLGDGQEINFFLSNPNVFDTDGDGFGDGFEVSTGFSPTSAASTPEALSTALTAVEYRFNAANGISYRIEASTDLANWQTIETPVIGAGGVITRFYSIEGQLRRFFRSRRN